jgi:hypothetical protein
MDHPLTPWQWVLVIVGLITLIVVVVLCGWLAPPPM